MRSAIPHPRILGVIRECGGKMWMGESKFISDVGRMSFSQNLKSNGRKRLPISSSPSAIMTNRVHRRGSRSSNTLSWQACSWEATSTLSTVRRQNRLCLRSRRLVDATHTAFRYKSDPQITAMTDLVGAYQRREVHEAERILRGTARLHSSYSITDFDAHPSFALRRKQSHDYG